MPSCDCGRTAGISRVALPEVFGAVHSLGSQCWRLVSSSISLCQSFVSSWAASLERKSPVFYLASGPRWSSAPPWAAGKKRKGTLRMVMQPCRTRQGRLPRAWHFLQTGLQSSTLILSLGRMLVPPSQRRA